MFDVHPGSFVNRLVLLAVSAWAAGCSVSRSEPTTPAAPGDDVVLRARRGFVLDGERLVNDQPQWRAVVSPEGVLHFGGQPLADAHAPTELSFELESITRGGALALRAPARTTSDGVVLLDHGAAVQRLETSGSHLEQSFEFDEAPGTTGPLVVTLRVRGFDHAGLDALGAHFTAQGTSVGVRYGHGTWVDARGERTAVPVELDGERLRLTVPAEVMARSRFPAVLDPTLDPEIVFPDGGTVVPAPRAQRMPVIAASDAGWLVVWEDLRHALYRGVDLYAARVLFDGGVLDPLGIPVVTAPGDQLDPTVTFNGENYVVAWRDQRNGGNHTWAAFVSPAGQVGGERRLVPGNNGDQLNPRAASNGELTLIAWEQVSLQAVRLLNDGGVLDPNGLQLAPWPSAAAHDLTWSGTAFVHSHEDNGPRVVFFDADGGARFWALPDGGSSPTLLLTTSTNNALYGRTIALTSLGGGRVAALWPRANGGQWPSAVHSALIDDDGGVSEVVLKENQMPWLDAQRVRVASDGTQLVGCVSGTLGQTPPNHVFGVSRRLSDDAVGPLVTLTTDAGAPSAECAVASGPGVSLLVYRTNHENEPTLRFQVLQGAVAPTTERLLSSAPNPQEHPAVAWSGTTSLPWLVAWSDARTPYRGFDLFLQRTNGTGLAGPTVQVSALAADEVGARLLGLGDAGYLLTWSEGNPLDATTPSVPRAQRVAANGTLGTRFELPVGTARYQAPIAARDGDALLVSAGHAGNLFDTWSFALDSDGGVTRTSTSLSVHDGVKLAPRGPGVFAAWDDGTSILGQQLGDGGTTRGAVVTLAQGTPSSRQRNVALAPATPTLVTWEDWSSGTPRLRARYLDEDGGLSATFDVSAMPGAQRFPSTAALADGRVLVAWEQETGSGVDVFVKLVLGADAGVDPLGRAWAGDGGASSNLRPVLATDGVNRAVLAWNRLSEDGRALSAHWRGVTIGLPLGGACTRDADCGEGPCVDGRCCDSACGGSDPNDCQTCAAAQGASADGRCTLLGAAHVCRPARDPFCDVEEACEGAIECPFDVVQHTGEACGTGGTCEASGACASDAGMPTGGGGGTSTGGGGGETGGGGGSATGGGDATGGGGGANDAGVDSISHYSWNQGCGCSGTSGAALLPALAFGLLLRLRRRGVRAGLMVGLVALLPLRAAAAEEPIRLAFSGLSCPSGIPDAEVQALSDYLHTRLSALGVYDVIGTSDIQQLIGLERQKALLGCSEGSSCLSEIGGALNAHRLLSGSIAKVGQTMVLNLTLLDSREGRAIHRNGARVKGQAVEAAFDLIDGLLLELAAKDPLVAAKLPAAPPKPADTGRSWTLSVGARMDADFVGIVKDGQAAVTPGVSLHFQDRIFGAAAAFVVAPVPGVRAELRVAWPDLAVRPYLGAGAVLFGPSFGLRACLGVLGRVGPIQLFLDAGVEGFLTGATQFHPLALLLGAGVAWAF